MSVCEDEGWDTAQDSEEECQLPEVSFTTGPSAINFLSQSYPLEPDMLFGWRPKLPLMPVPLSYSNLYVDWLITYIHNDPHGYRLVYLGPRLTNSVKVNQQHNYQWKQRDKYKLNVQVLRDTIELIGRNQQKRVLSPHVGDQPFTFSSDFQSGNLDAVIRVKPTEYDCFLRSDSNTRGHCNWFYFSVKCKKEGTVRLNICNLNKRTELYAKGMRPFVNDGSGWKQAGDNIAFVQRYCRYGFDIKHYQLQFSWTFSKAGQEVRFAYGIPYTYSELEQFVKEIKEKFEDKVEVDNLGQSLGGISIPVLTITDRSTNKLSKKAVLMTARLHPGESVSSHTIVGLVRALLTEDRYSQLLKTHEFRIVPMMNPDGVVLGNFRTSYSGKDLNRQFLNPDRRVYPEVEALNQFVSRLKQHYRARFEYYFDFHGHSTKTNLFCYGPEHPRTNPYYLRSRAFAKLMEDSDQLFSYRRSVFSISEHKRATSRANMLWKHKIPMSYTFELSNGLHEGPDRSVNLLSLEDMYRAGRLVLQSLGRFIGMNAPLVHQPAVLAKKRVHAKHMKEQIDPKLELLLKDMKPLRKNSVGKIRQRPLKSREQRTVKLTDLTNTLKLVGQPSKELEELLNRVKQQRPDRNEQGGSDSEDEIEDLSNEDLGRLHQQMFDREIKYNTSVSNQLEKKPVPQPLRTKKQTIETKKTVSDEPPQPPPRTLISRSVTARIRRKEPTPSQEKYLLAQKNFVLNI